MSLCGCEKDGGGQAFKAGMNREDGRTGGREEDNLGFGISVRQTGGLRRPTRTLLPESPNHGLPAPPVANRGGAEQAEKIKKIMTCTTAKEAPLPLTLNSFTAPIGARAKAEGLKAKERKNGGWFAAVAAASLWPNRPMGIGRYNGSSLAVPKSKIPIPKFPSSPPHLLVVRSRLFSVPSVCSVVD